MNTKIQEFYRFLGRWGAVQLFAPGAENLSYGSGTRTHDLYPSQEQIIKQIKEHTKYEKIQDIAIQWHRIN
jgi:hypothetical protein